MGANNGGGLISIVHLSLADVRQNRHAERQKMNDQLLGELNNV